MTGEAILSENRTLWRAEARATLSLAWPLILTNVAQMLIHATDVFLLGRVGPDALAASALGVGIVVSFLLFGIGVVTASSPMIASEIGRRLNSVRDVRRTFRQALWVATVVTIPMWVILWFAGDLLLLAGQPARLASDTGMFIRALQWELWPAFGLVAMRLFLSALERPGWSLIVGIGGVFANVLINSTLIFGHFGFPPLGLVGAGIGSSIVTFLMFIATAAVLMLHPRFRRYRLFGRFWRADWQRFREIWRLGSPIGLTMAFEASVFAAAVFLMGYISTASTAAHAVAIQIASMTFMVPMGIAQAATVRVGIGYGRGDAAAIRRAGWTAFMLGTAFMTAMAIIIWIVPRQLAAIFIDPTMAGNAEVLDLAVSFLAVAAVFQIVDGAQVVGAGMLRGLHDTKWPMLFAAVGYWVIGIGVGALLAFTAHWDGVGVWIGLAVGLAVVAILMLQRWMRRDALGLLPTSE